MKTTNMITIALLTFCLAALTGCGQATEPAAEQDRLCGSAVAYQLDKTQVSVPTEIADQPTEWTEIELNPDLCGPDRVCESEQDPDDKPEGSGDWHQNMGPKGWTNLRIEAPTSGFLWIEIYRDVNPDNYAEYGVFYIDEHAQIEISEDGRHISRLKVAFTSDDQYAAGDELTIISELYGYGTLVGTGCIDYSR